MNPHLPPDSIFTVEADQWLEHGFVLRGNQVIAYEADRKEQTYIEFGSQSLVDFMADATVPEEIKRWAESSAKNNNWPSLSPLVLRLRLLAYRP
jgi:hypothetical protein